LPRVEPKGRDGYDLRHEPGLQMVASATQRWQGRSVIVRATAHARAGLIGNPSDGYHGKTISIIVRNFSACVALYESTRLAIRPQHCDRLEYDDLTDLARDVERHGYYGGVRLIKAAIKHFANHSRSLGHELPTRNFTIEYDTDIPVRVGLAGSSAIVTATMRALMRFFEVEIAQPQLPKLILDVERRELGIGAGLQDRVAQVYEGAVYMDFDRQVMERQGYGVYEPLDPATLPPLFVAYHDRLAEGTEVTHNDLRDRYTRGEPDVLAAIEEWAGFAQEARDLIVSGRGKAIGPLMDANFDLRARIVSISSGNRRLVETGRACGAAVKFAGSGGAVIGTYDGDPERLRRLREAYSQMGATLIEPCIVPDTPCEEPTR
jgi:glucuronokinase